MKLDDGREALCTLALPLPLALVVELSSAIEAAAEKAGYTDVAFSADTNAVSARRRADTEETT